MAEKYRLLDRRTQLTTTVNISLRTSKKIILASLEKSDYDI